MIITLTIIALTITILGVALIVFSYYRLKKGYEHNLLGVVAKIIIPFISILLLFITGVIYNKYEYEVVDWVKLVKYTFSTFGFEIEKSIVYPLFNNNLLYKVTWIITFPYAIGTVYYTIISQFTNALNNFVGIRKALSKNCDILIGLNEFDSYKQNNKNLIVWLDKTASKEDEKKLMANGIHYVKKSFTYNNIKSLPMKKNGKVNYHFISFDTEQNNLGYISEFKKFLDSDIKGDKAYKLQSYFIHAEIGIDNLVTIQNKILVSKKEFSPFINLFNRFELVSIKFNEEYPLSKYISNLVDENTGAINVSDELNEIKINYFSSKTGTVVNETIKYNDKPVNVIYLGYGKVSKEIHRGSIMNNQLISIDKNNKLKNHLINYFAFDNHSFNAEDKNNIYYQNRFRHNKDEYNNNDEYYETPEDVGNFYPIPVDINTTEVYDDIISITKMKNSFTSIIVSMADDLDNIDYALKLVQLFKQQRIENVHIFVRIKKHNSKTIELLKDNSITFFGWKESVLNHDVIVNDNLLNLAKLMSGKYNEKHQSLLSIGWYELSPIKQKSNIYASLNLRLKLNLIGYDYEICDELVDNNSLLKELREKIKYGKKDYDNYLFFKKAEKPCISNILSYQEHSRWNAFYISNGYVPLPKNEISLKYENNKCVLYKDNDDIRMHACITTYEDLDNYHRDIAKLICNDKKYTSTVLKIDENKLNELSDEEIFNMVISEKQTYKYDYDLIDSFELIFNNSNYKLKKLNK